MYLFWTYLFFFWFNLPSWIRVEERNRLKKEILQAYQTKNQPEVVTRAKVYQTISTVIEPEIRWMVGQAYLDLQQWDLAQEEFTQLQRRTEGPFRSDVYVAQARLSLAQKDTAQSLLYLEQAILENPTHPVAQYNYELLKKLYHPGSENPPPPPPSPNPEGGTVVLSPEKEANLSPDPPTRIPRERALQMLDNLRSNERSIGTSKKKSGSTTNPKNDW